MSILHHIDAIQDKLSKAGAITALMSEAGRTVSSTQLHNAARASDELIGAAKADAAALWEGYRTEKHL